MLFSIKPFVWASSSTGLPAPLAKTVYVRQRDAGDANRPWGVRAGPLGPNLLMTSPQQLTILAAYRLIHAKTQKQESEARLELCQCLRKLEELGLLVKSNGNGTTGISSVDRNESPTGVYHSER